MQTCAQAGEQGPVQRGHAGRLVAISLPLHVHMLSVFFSPDLQRKLWSSPGLFLPKLRLAEE